MADEIQWWQHAVIVCDICQTPCQRPYNGGTPEDGLAAHLYTVHGIVR